MRKFYLFLTALVAFATSANAGIKVLYNQDFEAATDVASTQWVSPSAAGGLSISSDKFGKFIRFTQSGNDRSAHLLWGTDLIKSANVASYTVSFEMSATAWGSNHSTTEYTIMSDETNCTKKPNNNFRANSANWLFDLTQIPEASGGKALAATGDQVFAINGDSAYTVTLSSGVFYKVTLDIDTIARTVDWKIENPAKKVTVASNTYAVPEGTSMIATGLYFLGARYNHNQVFDNIRVSTYVDEEVANNPSVALTGINNQQRIYKIQFLKGETLHLSFQGNELDPISFADCDGEYVWSNNPNFNPENEELVNDACATGTLVAWTTSGSAISEKISEEVSNEIIALPAASAAIANVEEGFGKSYTLTVDNSSTPLSPKIFIAYKFIPSDSSTPIQGTDLSTGASIQIPGKGTIEITTSAFGYQPTTITVANDIEYELAKQVDYMNWTGEELAANAKFTRVNYTDTNRSHWIGKWMNQYTTETVDPETKANTGIWWKAPSQLFKVAEEAAAYLQFYELKNEDDNYAKELLPLIPNTARASVTILVEEGIVANTTAYNNLELTVDPNYVSDSPAKPNFAVVNLTGSYDRYDRQPDCHSVRVIKTDATDFSVTRFDTAINSVKLYTYKGFVPGSEPTGISTISSDAKANENAPIYNLAGQKVGKDYKGVVIQNGKKFILK